jgi:xanthine dehydrogenase iron-sulfur cluster and FAD-binding subunit A
MELLINGKNYSVDETPDRLLLWVLRDELGLTGTKFGCGVGICGSCTVHMDGAATRSCITMLSQAAGKEIRTLEGLATELSDGSLELHPGAGGFYRIASSSVRLLHERADDDRCGFARRKPQARTKMKLSP